MSINILKKEAVFVLQKFMFILFFSVFAAGELLILMPAVCPKLVWHFCRGKWCCEQTPVHSLHVRVCWLLIYPCCMEDSCKIHNQPVTGHDVNKAWKFVLGHMAEIKSEACHCVLLLPHIYPRCEVAAVSHRDTCTHSEVHGRITSYSTQRLAAVSVRALSDTASFRSQTSTSLQTVIWCVGEKNGL